MKNYSNIYDIDGNIIRKAGDNHKFTLDEVEKIVDDLTKKVQENPDNEVYKVYLNNAQKWLFNMYNNMSKEELTKRLSSLKDIVQSAKDKEVDAEQKNLKEINEVIDEFTKQYDKNTVDVLDEEGNVVGEAVESVGEPE